MSKPRYQWWGYVKWVIKDYPSKCRELAEMRKQSTSAKLSGMPGSSEPQRGPENLVLRGFTGQKANEHGAVERAIATTKQYDDGWERLNLINRVFWDKTHTLSGAALACFVSYETAVNWHREFIKLVASYMGLLDE